MSKRLITETLIYGVGAILPKLVNFLLIKVFAGVNGIPTDEFSIFAQVFAFASVINVLISFGFETAFFRYVTKTGDKQKTFHTAFWFIFVNALSFFIVMLFFYQEVALLINYENPEYLLWFAGFVLFDSICVMPFALLRFENRPIKFSLIRIANSVLYTTLILLLFYVIPEDVHASYGLNRKVSYPFFATLLASFFTVLMLSQEIYRVRFSFDVLLFKKMFAYAYPVMLAGLAFAINENLDKIVMREILSKEVAGAYAGCYKLAVFMTLFVTAFRMGIEPYFFKKSSSENAKEIYADIMQYFVILSCCAAITIIANIEWLKYVLISNQNYFLAIDVVPIVVMANLFFGIYTNLSVWYKVTDSTHFGMKISWIGATITIVFNLILLKHFGFLVAAWATLIAYGIMMILSYLLGRKHYKVPYKRNKILFYLVFTAIIIAVQHLIFHSNIILGNLLLILYIAITFWIEKASLKINKT